MFGKSKPKRGIIPECEFCALEHCECCPYYNEEDKKQYERQEQRRHPPKSHFSGGPFVFPDESESKGSKKDRSDRKVFPDYLDEFYQSYKSKVSDKPLDPEFEKMILDVFSPLLNHSPNKDEENPEEDDGFDNSGKEFNPDFAKMLQDAFSPLLNDSAKDNEANPNERDESGDEDSENEDNRADSDESNEDGYLDAYENCEEDYYSDYDDAYYYENEYNSDNESDS